MAAHSSPPPVAASSRSDEPSDAFSSPPTLGSSGHVRPSTPLRVAIIGGLTRATHEWERAGKALGIVLEHHDGRAHGCRADSLAAMVRRADIVVTITIPNSHNAVSIARRTALQHGRGYLQVKRLRPSGLASVIADVQALAHPGKTS